MSLQVCLLIKSLPTVITLVRFISSMYWHVSPHMRWGGKQPTTDPTCTVINWWYASLSTCNREHAVITWKTKRQISVSCYIKKIKHINNNYTVSNFIPETSTMISFIVETKKVHFCKKKKWKTAGGCQIKSIKNGQQCKL